MTALLKSTLRRSLKATPTVHERDRVAGALDAIMAAQRTASRAAAENPEAGDDEDADTGEQRRDEALMTERQRITADHYEAWSVDHEYRGGDE